MKLSSLLEKDLILNRVPVKNREDAVRLSIDRLFDKKKIIFDKDKIIEEINARDKLGGTVFKSGLAIPHARIKEYGDLSIVVCIPDHPVDVEGQPVDCFVVMITSLAVSNLYLQVLAALAKLSNDKDFFHALTNSTSAEAFLELTSDKYVKKELTVEDLMSTDNGILKPEMTLKDATDIFYMKKTSYLPVLSEDGHFLGELRINDLISVGIPDYAKMIGSLSFLNSFEPFEKLMNEEDDILVSSVMKQSLVSLTPESSVVEAALKMTQGNFRHLPVIKDGELIGILNIMDILNKVLRR
ncbi:MAG TPA: hypothetical protein DCO79_07920 [Spirochaeta sp.]|nr:hypothetical protein [Spirochaeta sp.]